MTTAAIRDAALGQHEQDALGRESLDAMRKATNIFVRVETPVDTTLYTVMLDWQTIYMTSDPDKAETVADDLAAQLVRDGMVTL